MAGQKRLTPALLEKNEMFKDVRLVGCPASESVGIFSSELDDGGDLFFDLIAHRIRDQLRRGGEGVVGRGWVGEGGDGGGPRSSTGR